MNDTSTFTSATAGTATGNVRQVLRLEALAILVAATSAYFVSGGSAWLFAILFFAPDLRVCQR